MIRLLLGNIGLENLHGSEIWTWTIAEYLNTKGFKVTILANDIGDFARDYLFNFEVVKSVSGRKFDLGILSHARMLNDIENVKVEKALLVSHGYLDESTRPIKYFHCPYSYVSISEEVRAHWFNEMGIESSVIVNPIRDEWFKMESETIGLHSIVFANHRHEVPEEMVNILKAAGIHFRRLRRGWSQRDVMAFMKASQIIIGTGRYIYEAMAAGIRVIVADSKHSMGYVTKDNYADLVHYNMTCRNPEAYAPNWDRLIEEFDKHDPGDMRELALKYHHVDIIGKQLLGYFDEQKA